MFMEIAISAIGIGVVLMVGYLVIAQVRMSLANSVSAISNVSGLELNGTLATTQSTIFAGFSLIAVGIIVLAAFGLIAVFK